MKILVTGASGFVGSAFVRDTFEVHRGDHVVALVRDTSQIHMRRLQTAAVSMAMHEGRCRIVNGDLLGDISGIAEGCDAVVHFAAKTFVDHSIRDPLPFVEANVLGTYRILEEARRNGVKRFIQISTDEVYGPIAEGYWKEDARINPTNPYSASKVGADALVMSYTHGYGLWTAITRTENVYGPYQHPQKAMPAFVRCILTGKKIPLYGDGQHRRQWLWVYDQVAAVRHLLTADVEPGQVFHVAGKQELENIDLAKKIVAILRPSDDPIEWIKFIDDQKIRPGHDRRYALSCTKINNIGWFPKMPLDQGISTAVRWYADNLWWLG